MLVYYRPIDLKDKGIFTIRNTLSFNFANSFASNARKQGYRALILIK